MARTWKPKLVSRDPFGVIALMCDIECETLEDAKGMAIARARMQMSDERFFGNSAGVVAYRNKFYSVSITPHKDELPKDATIMFQTDVVFWRAAHFIQFR